MERLLIEWEIFCEVIERKSYVIYVPTAWMFFCMLMMIYLDKTSTELIQHEQPVLLAQINAFVYQIVQTRISFIALLALGGGIYLMGSLYLKERKRIY